MTYLKMFTACALVLAALVFPASGVMAADDSMVLLYNDGSTQRIRVELDRPSKSIKQIEFQKGRRVFVSEGRGGDHDDWKDARINVISATYGKNCRAPYGNVTNQLAEVCNGKSTCEYIIDYRVLGDPATGCAKDYFAEWQCGRDQKKNGIRVRAEAGGGTRIELRCPPIR